MTSDDGVPVPGNGYRKGPVLLRRGQVPTTTTDQRLLAGPGNTYSLNGEP